MSFRRSGDRRRGGAFYFWMGFLIPSLIVLAGFIAIKIWPSGDGIVLIIDSLHQYLPFYTDFHEKLVHHESLLYSFSAGLGYNFWATYAYYLASPVNFLLRFVPTANVCDFMDLVILLKLGLCGGTFSWYLYARDAKPLSGRDFAGTKEQLKKASMLPVVFGTLWAVSYFMIGYYFNLMWLDSIAMLPLIMRGIEEILTKKDGRLYCLALAYGLWCNYYIGFMLCLFSVIYFLAFWIIRGHFSLKRDLGAVLRFGVSSLLAGGMGAMVLYPAYKALTISESMESNHFPMTLRFYTSFLDMMLTHFAGRDPINISNTQVGLNSYCTVGAIVLGLLYLFDRKIALREKIVRYALLALMLASFATNYLNYIWHGFHQQNGLPNRFAFIYICLLLVMAHDALRDIEFVPRWGALIAGIVPAAFAAAAYLFKWGDLPSYVCLITLGLLLLYLGMLLIVKFGSLRVLTASLLIGTLLASEAAGSAVYGIIYNDNVTRSIYLKDQASYKNLMAKQADPSWYRSEIDSQRMRNVTMFAGGHATVMFNSTMQSSVTNFCDRIGMEARTNKNGYNGVTSLMNDVLGIKYVLSSNGHGSTLYQFRKIDADDNLTLYENDDALPLGFMVRDSIRGWNIEEGSPIDVQNSFVELATGLRPIFVLDRYVDLEEGVAAGVHIPDGKQVCVYLPERVKELKLETPEYNKTYTTYTDHLYVINSCDGNTEASFTPKLDGNSRTASIYTCPDSAEKEVVDLLWKSPLTDADASGSHLNGKINAAEDGILLLTIPYDTGWTCRVDGVIVTPEKIGDTLMGLPVAAGEHTIALAYTPLGFRTGILLSLVSILLFVLLCALHARRKHAEDSNGESLYEEELPQRVSESVEGAADGDTEYQGDGPFDTDVPETDAEDDAADADVPETDDGGPAEAGVAETDDESPADGSLTEKPAGLEHDENSQ